MRNIGKSMRHTLWFALQNSCLTSIVNTGAVFHFHGSARHSFDDFTERLKLLTNIKA